MGSCVNITGRLGVVGRWRRRAGNSSRITYPKFLDREPVLFVASQLGFHVSNLVCKIKVKGKRRDAPTQMHTRPLKHVILL